MIISLESSKLNETLFRLLILNILKEVQDNLKGSQRNPHKDKIYAGPKILYSLNEMLQADFRTCICPLGIIEVAVTE